jgi:hypothetical protein
MGSSHQWSQSRHAGLRAADELNQHFRLKLANVQGVEKNFCRLPSAVTMTMLWKITNMEGAAQIHLIWSTVELAAKVQQANEVREVHPKDKSAFL